MAEQGRLNGQAAVVTGGASGFGEGIVRRFVAEGARVAIADIDLSAARRLADQLGPAALAVAVDVSDAGRVAEGEPGRLQPFEPLERDHPIASHELCGWLDRHGIYSVSTVIS